MVNSIPGVCVCVVLFVYESDMIMKCVELIYANAIFYINNIQCIHSTQTHAHTRVYVHRVKIWCEMSTRIMLKKKKYKDNSKKWSTFQFAFDFQICSPLLCRKKVNINWFESRARKCRCCARHALNRKKKSQNENQNKLK